MALLRNRQVNVLGPNGAEVSPIYTVMYPDGSREDVPLKFIHMTQSELDKFRKNQPLHGDYVRVITDKEHAEVIDNQDPTKIKERVKKGEVNVDDTLIQVPSYVKSADVVKAKPQTQVVDPRPGTPVSTPVSTPVQSPTAQPYTPTPTKTNPLVK